MSRALTSRLVISVLLVSTAISACQKKPDETPKAETKRESTAPLSYVHNTVDAEASLYFPDSFKAHATLHETLSAQDQTALKEFANQAVTDRAELANDGFEQPQYFRKIVWHLTAETTGLISTYSQIEEYAGGAHGNLAFHPVLWDKASDKPLDPQTLFAADADLKPAENYLCRQVEAERSKRAETPITQASSGFGCPKLKSAHFVLIPSTEAGKAAAIDVLFAPYEVGPYAEGTYQIRLPLNIIKDAIAPAYAAQFGGNPAPLPVENLPPEALSPDQE